MKKSEKMRKLLSSKTKKVVEKKEEKTIHEGEKLEDFLKEESILQEIKKKIVRKKD